MKLVRKTFQLGHQTFTLETGRIAKQTSGSVLVTVDKTAVLVAVVGAKTAKEGQDFFPLAVHYQEKTYATGRIPGGFQKREGRPSDKETLTSRLIDRPIRPLFPKDFTNEVQVVATVISACKNNDPDIAALLGTSAALAISGMPFNGPIGAARVGYHPENGYILNPSYQQLSESLLDMVVAGTKDAVLMVESEAKELPEDLMLGAVLFGHAEMQSAIQAIREFAEEVNTPKWEWAAPEQDNQLIAAITEKHQADITSAYQIPDKMSRYAKMDQIKTDAIDSFCQSEANSESSPSVSKNTVKEIIGSIEKTFIRQQILDGQPRIDGRDTKTVRPISVEVGILPSAHGSALFTRGETQALVVTTLGSMRDAQLIDALEGERKDHLMLHYNFPPYSVGETGFMGGPKRREIGHGRLAKRGIQAVMPADADFPYVIRIVSEITESNGSSSMASVCGSSLALMDAGVPLKAPVAGIAMGLIKENDQFAVLTDILGDEDHLGDMDFKVAGTKAGVTALQMDIKIEGITEEIMEIALKQANEARIHILGEMNTVIDAPRAEVADNAPHTLSIQVNPDKIRDIIGKGGATIRKLSEDTNSSIDIDDNGLVRIYGESKENALQAFELIKDLTTDVEAGQVYMGTVSKIVDFGAFITIPGGKEGLLHISQISEERVNDVNDYLKVAQEVSVTVKEIDHRGRIKLSMK